MYKILHRSALALGLLIGIWGCGSGGDELTITGPDLPSGPGKAYPLEQVSFPSIDGVQVSALFGQTRGEDKALPVVILVHDLTLNNQEWFLSPFFAELLERGYLPLAIDLRGHGNTPLPDNRPAPQLEDLENTYLDVQAGLTWLRHQPAADISRIAVIGAGVGGNIAYVSIGAFPQQIKTAVALSPGFWDANFQPLVVGARLNPFAPHSMLFMVGSEDAIPVDGGQVNLELFSRALLERTGEPRSLVVLQGANAHGVSLLGNSAAEESLFSWLQTHL